tara:strand:+ start:214 stop:651 length:438 start_codon:yes stop_codon:yes gene_type:complete
MPSKFASGKFAIAECDRCGFRYKLKQLKTLVIKTKQVNLLVCPSCWEKDQPQLQVGMYPVFDPQAIQNPRPDNSYIQSGLTGLQVDVIAPADPDDVDAFGTPGEGSRNIQWGWNPVGLNNPLGLSGLVDTLVGQGQIGVVSIVTN